MRDIYQRNTDALLSSLEEEGKSRYMHIVQHEGEVTGVVIAASGDEASRLVQLYLAASPRREEG